jgi:ketosteroid isomerase-like protein
MSHETDVFAEFMQRRAEAAGAYICGDPAPLGELAARSGDATFYAPRGGAVTGAEAVWSTYERDAAAFAPGGESRFEILHMAASDGLAYWVGYQRATVYMRGRAEAVEFNLRVTEVFRREGADWKLVHRHADSLATDPAE